MELFYKNFFKKSIDSNVKIKKELNILQQIAFITIYGYNVTSTKEKQAPQRGICFSGAVNEQTVRVSGQ
ncbi:MAG: hypothetical protein E7286_08885 [Lachnospiraceae bacterium]|nr:hypothetical protein [Lachnospiraceae bacterium]